MSCTAQGTSPVLRLWFQKLWSSNPNSFKSRLSCAKLWPPLHREGGVEEETSRFLHILLCPAELRALGKGLQAGTALLQSPLPAAQFKCMISVNINNLEGLQIINTGISWQLLVMWIRELHTPSAFPQDVGVFFCSFTSLKNKVQRCQRMPEVVPLGFCPEHPTLQYCVRDGWGLLDGQCEFLQ